MSRRFEPAIDGGLTPDSQHTGAPYMYTRYG